MSRRLAAFVVALSSFAAAPVEAGDAGAAVTSLTANGDVVWAATEGAGLRLSTDGGATFAPVPEVVCPRATVRDVAAGGVQVAAACSDFETAFLLTGGSWTRRGSTLAASDVYAHPKDAGVGRPLLHFDAIDGRAPTRLTGYARCDYEGCEIYATVEAGASVVSQRYTGFPEYPGSTPRLLAPSSARSPFVVSTTRGDGADGAGATVVRRGLARDDLPRLVFTYGTRPGTSGDEVVGSVPDAIVTLRRAPSRSSRLVAAGTRGLWITDDEGASWRLAKGAAGPLSDVVIAPDDASRFVVARGRDIAESTDGGETFVDLAGEGPSDVTSLAFDASSPARLFVGRADGNVDLVKLARPLSSAAGTPLLLAARYEPADGSLTLSAAIRSDEAATYRIERRDFGSGDFSRLSNLVVDARLSSASFRDPFPPPDRSLGYRVVAARPDGVEFASAEIFAVAPTTEPIAPDGLAAAEVSPGRFRLSWNDRSAREEGYLLEFLGATGWRPFVSLPADTTSFDLPGGSLVPKFFRLSAFNARGKSAPSEITSAGGAPPTASVSLQAEKGDGLAARLSMRTIGFEEILLERSVDDAPFVEIARPRTLDGNYCCRTTFVDTARTPDHDVVYRARVVNPAGVGPESLASLGTWTSPPEAPDGLAASFADDRITASWNDRSTSEDGFRLFSKRPFAPGEVMLGDTTRGRARFEGYNLGYSGDVDLTVRAFNSAGLSAPSPPFRLRIWPYVESLAEESTGLTPELVPFVVEKTGGDGSEEHTEIERFARSLYDGPTYYGRFLDSVSDTLLQIEVPLPRIERGQNPFIVTSRAFVDSVMRPQQPSLPRGDVAGALLSYAQRALGARTHVRVKANFPGGDADGRPGFGFSGRQVKELTAGPLAFAGLRREGPLTSSLTLVHPGVDPRPLVFGVTLFDGESGASTDLPGVTVARGAVVTLEDVLSLSTPPARQGWAIVRRVEGDSPIDAFAVAHDRLSFDGAYIGAAGVVTSRALWLPAVVESATYETEAVFTNGLDRDVEILVTVVESLPAYRADLAPVSFTVGARRQLIVPSFVDALRRRGVPLGTRGETRVGTVRVTRADGGALGAVFVGQRVVSSDGRYALYVGGVAEGKGTEGRRHDASGAFDGITHVYGLPENPRERSNAVVANVSLEPVTVRADVVSCPALVYDIACGALPRVEGSTAFTLRPGEWFQMHRPFRAYGRERGLVNFTRLSGPGPLYAYSVVVDAVTGDGTFFEASGSEP